MKVLKALVRCCTFLIIITLSSSTTCAGQNLEWARTFGQTNYDFISDFEIDESQNIYITGTFCGTIDLATEENPITLEAYSECDILVAKLNPDGLALWAFNIGGDTYSGGNGISLDDNQNIYITGYFDGTADFDPSNNDATLSILESQINPINSPDGFIAKYDSGGNYIWAHHIGGRGIDKPLNIVFSPDSSFYLNGNYTDTANFSTNPLEEELLIAQNFSDAFVAKYDLQGQLIWLRGFGGASTESANELIVLDDQSIIVSGDFSVNVEFVPGGETITDQNGNDIILTRYDVDGNLVWANAISGENNEGIRAIQQVDSNSFIIGGYFSNSIIFNVGTNEEEFYYSTQLVNGFIASYSIDGDYDWSINFGGPEYGAFVNALAIDDQKNIFATGGFLGSIDLDPGPDSAGFTSMGSSDIYLAKFDSLGNYQWGQTVGGLSQNSSTGLHLDQQENILLFGTFKSAIDLDPGPGEFTFSSNGQTDPFIAKYTCTGNTQFSQTACQEYISPSGNHIWSNSGIYSDTLFYGTECFNSLTIDLDIIQLDSTVTLNESVMVANQDEAEYQWFNCANPQVPISGANEQIFSPMESGEYGVLISINGCEATSECYNFIVSSVNNPNPSQVVVYPNPTNGIFSISSKMSPNSEFRLFDITARIALTGKLSIENTSIDISNFPDGLYFLRVNDHIIKIVKH